jgi:hypothetical protein
VVEISREGIRDYHGTYEEYVHACGDDHLDADTVVLKARRQERKGRAEAASPNGKPRAATTFPTGGRGDGAGRLPRLEKRRDEITSRIDELELGIAEIDRTFAAPRYFEKAPADEIAQLRDRRSTLQDTLDQLMGEWEGVEREIEEGSRVAGR